MKGSTKSIVKLAKSQQRGCSDRPCSNQRPRAEAALRVLLIYTHLTCRDDPDSSFKRWRPFYFGNRSKKNKKNKKLFIFCLQHQQHIIISAAITSHYCRHGLARLLVTSQIDYDWLASLVCAWASARRCSSTTFQCLCRLWDRGPGCITDTVQQLMGLFDHVGVSATTLAQQRSRWSTRSTSPDSLFMNYKKVKATGEHLFPWVSEVGGADASEHLRC